MNAVQAIGEGSNDDPRIMVVVHRDTGLGLDENPSINGFTVTDNGVGFHDANMDSFNTAFSTYKLAQGGKGLGRLTWAKAFDAVEIESNFFDEEEGQYIQRRWSFGLNYDPDAVVTSPSDITKTGTTVALSGFSDPWKAETSPDILQLARRICEHFVLILMDENCPLIEIVDGKSRISVNKVFADSFRANSSSTQLEIRGRKFSVISFRISEPRSSRNRIIYCADQRAVITESLDKFLPNFSGRMIDEDGESFVYLVVVTGNYLNERVNPARTDFLIGDPEAEGLDDPGASSELFEDEIRRSDIRNGVLEFVQSDSRLSP